MPLDVEREKQTSLLFIHGWRTGFTAAITRAIQLKVDLDYSDVVVFTWPSDNSGIISSYDAAASGGLFVASIISSYGAAASEGLLLQSLCRVTPAHS